MLFRHGNQLCQGLGINTFEITQVGWKDTDREHAAATANMWQGVDELAQPMG